MYNKNSKSIVTKNTKNLKRTSTKEEIEAKVRVTLTDEEL